MGSRENLQVTGGAGFQSRPQVEFEGSLVKLLAECRWLSSDRKLGIVLPRGFECDLDSRPGWLPGFVRAFMASAVQAAAAAILHDYLYKYGGYWGFGGQWHPVSKRQADAFFYEALTLEPDAGTELSSWLFWGGVAAGGWFSWWGHRRADKRPTYRRF